MAVLPPQPRLAGLRSQPQVHRLRAPQPLPARRIGADVAARRASSQGEAPALICTSRMAPMRRSPSSGVVPALVSFNCSIGERSPWRAWRRRGQGSRCADPFGSVSVGRALAPSIASIFVPCSNHEIGPRGAGNVLDEAAPLRMYLRRLGLQESSDPLLRILGGVQFRASRDMPSSIRRQWRPNRARISGSIRGSGRDRSRKAMKATAEDAKSVAMRTVLPLTVAMLLGFGATAPVAAEEPARGPVAFRLRPRASRVRAKPARAAECPIKKTVDGKTFCFQNDPALTKPQGPPRPRIPLHLHRGANHPSEPLA